MTPLASSWLASMVVNGDEVILTTANNKRLRYKGVPAEVGRALMTANSPGRIWRELFKGKYGEKPL